MKILDSIRLHVEFEFERAIRKMLRVIYRLDDKQACLGIIKGLVKV